MTAEPVAPRTAPRRDPQVLAFPVLTGFVLLWYGLDLGGPGLQVVLSWAFVAGLQATDVVIGLGIARVRGISAPAAWFWRLLATGCGLWGVGSAGECVRALIVPAQAVAAPSSVEVVTLGLGALAVVIAMLTFPLGLSGGRERRRFWLDAATVMVGAVIFAWFFGGPSSADVARGWAVLGRELIGPALFVVIGFGLLRLALTRNPPFTTVGAAFGGLAALIEVGSTGLDHTLVAVGHRSWSTALGMLANLALTTGFTLQQRQVRADATLLRHRPAGPYSRLPYAAVAGTYALLSFEMAGSSISGRTWAVLVAAIGCTTLVVLRQLAAFADNAELLGRLDTKVRELAETQRAMQQALDERDVLAGQLRHQAEHDALTGLANRSLFLREIDAALARARRSGIPAGVLMIDLNDFKPVNDRLGHHAGDLLLQELATRMTRSVREVDTVARLGGDEFAVLVELGTDLDVVVARIAEAIEQPVDVEGTPVRVGASIGAVTSDGHEGDAEQLIRSADRLMYERKQRTKHERALTPAGANREQAAP
jgi:diguanylate cyclase (GGDEF)-like protein